MVVRRDPKKLDAPVLPPATTIEGRESQLVSMAYDLAEQQLRDGTISAQVQSQLIKAGSSRQKIEDMRLEMETKIMQAKTEALEAERSRENSYEEALKAMRRYTQGDTPETEE